MNIAGVTLRDLEYIVAVAERKHFGHAAESCGVSQPALSGQVKKTEELLGVRLFERTKRRVLITPMGQELVAQARLVLEGMRKLGELARGRSEPLSGRFGLGAIATLGPYLLPHVLGALRRGFPQLELRLREGLTHGLLQELKAGALDAVLLATPVADEALQTEPLFREPFLLAVPAEHPLAHKRSVGLRDLRADDMVLLEDGHCLRDQALEVCRGDGHGANPRFQATSLETLRHLVASGAGYTLVPALAVARGREELHPLIRYRRLGAPEPGRTVALAWRREFPRIADIAALAAIIRRNLPRFARA